MKVFSLKEFLVSYQTCILLCYIREFNRMESLSDTIIANKA